MNRRNLLTLSLATVLGGIASRVSGAGAAKPPKASWALDSISAPPVPLAGWNLPTPKPSDQWVYDDGSPTSPLSGRYIEGRFWCKCPACYGSGFRGADRDECSYCKMDGRLVTTETFAMYNGEGNAEVWRALVWHEWSQRNWRESDGPRPWLPGMLYYFGQRHPEVYDTAVRDYIFAWLEKRFDKAHAQAQYDAWVAEIKRHEVYPDEKRYGRDGALEEVPYFAPGCIVSRSRQSSPVQMTVEGCAYLTKDGQPPMVQCVWFEGESVKRGFFHPSELVLS